MLSTEGFVYPQEVKVCYDTVDNEMSALARLTFYENLFIGQETSVRCVYQRVSVSRRVEFRENVWGFARDKESCP